MLFLRLPSSVEPGSLSVVAAEAQVLTSSSSVQPASDSVTSAQAKVVPSFAPLVAVLLQFQERGLKTVSYRDFWLEVNEGGDPHGLLPLLKAAQLGRTAYLTAAHNEGVIYRHRVYKTGDSGRVTWITLR
jgi:hypothetical protein